MPTEGLTGLKRARFFVVWLTFLLPTLCHAEHLPFKSYTVSDGLSHNEVFKIVRDSRGFLWFCTAGGLSRFDGYSFTNFGADQGLPDASVTDFLETRNGQLWIATSGGLVRFNPKGRSGKSDDAKGGPSAEPSSSPPSSAGSCGNSRSSLKPPRA